MASAAFILYTFSTSQSASRPAPLKGSLLFCTTQSLPLRGGGTAGAVTERWNIPQVLHPQLPKARLNQRQIPRGIAAGVGHIRNQAVAVCNHVPVGIHNGKPPGDRLDPWRREGSVKLGRDAGHGIGQQQGKRHLRVALFCVRHRLGRQGSNIP